MIECIIFVWFGFTASSQKLSELHSDASQIKFRAKVINMDGANKRYDMFVEGYNKSDMSSVPLTRFRGIPGRDLVPKEWLTDKALMDLQMIEQTGYRTGHYQVTRGAIGCFLSHYSLAKELVAEEDIEGYVIFEDDVYLKPDAFHQIKGLMMEVPDDWDYVLFWYHNVIGYNRYVNNSKLQSVDGFWGMMAYMMSKNGAMAFIRQFEADDLKIDVQVDAYMSVLAQKGKLNIYSPIKKGVVKHSSKMPSQIQMPIRPIPCEDPCLVRDKYTVCLPIWDTAYRLNQAKYRSMCRTMNTLKRQQHN